MTKWLEPEVAVPRVLLPVGNTTAARPRIEWRWPRAAEGWKVRIRDAKVPVGADSIFWESPVLPAHAQFVIPDSDLPSHSTLYAEVRALANGIWTPWGTASVFYIDPIVPLHGAIVVYDLNYTREMSPLNAFAHAHLVSVLQGLVNQKEPRLYVTFVQTDRKFGGKKIDLDTFWLDRMTECGGWLCESLIRRINTLPDLLELFTDAYNGLVVWDPAVPGTSNVASTIAGADALLPVPVCCDPASLYTELIIEQQIPVVVDLQGKFTGTGTVPGTNRPSTGSAKCDAYLWAVENYLATGKCDPCYMGHYIDGWWVRNPGAGGNLQNHTLTNHDYFIAKRGFFWDLNVWTDEAPVDDPEQVPGTDVRTLREILTVANGQIRNSDMIHVGGFTPWAFKYTTHREAGGKHDPVPTEWELVRILSAYNAYVDADALGLGAMANASFLSHYPLPPHYAPVLSYTPGELREAGLLKADGRVEQKDFFLNYTGDYDSAAWAWGALSQIWESPERGKTTISWAVNPNLADRAAPLFEHLYKTRTASDHFMAGDSGAGYVNPTQLLAPRDPSQLPDASQTWIHHCLSWYRRFGLRFTGFLINGHSGPVTAAAERMYQAFSPDGIVNPHRREGRNYRAATTRMPVFDMLADIDDLERGVPSMQHLAESCGDRPRFLVFRQILESPQYYKDLYLALKHKKELDPVFCDPHSFSALARVQLGVSNDDQYSLLVNTIPGRARAGDVIKGDIALRNDGWNTWQPGEHALHMEIISYGSGDGIWKKTLPLPKAISPGEAALWEVELPLPDFAGEYLLDLDMTRNGEAFSANAGYGVEQRIKIKRADVAATL